ncbi:MAG: hypothetical protein ABJC26_06175 [Gemmatimonadaceae bacterium]
MRLLRSSLFAVFAFTVAAIAAKPIRAQERLGSAFGEITLGKTSITGGNYSKGGAFFNAGGMLGGRFHQRERTSLLTALSFDRTINVATGDTCLIPSGNAAAGCQPEKPSTSYIGVLFGIEPHCENACFNFLGGPGLTRVGRTENNVKHSASTLGVQAVVDFNLQLGGGVWLAIAAKGLSMPNFTDPSTSSYLKPNTALFSKSLSLGIRIQEH